MMPELRIHTLRRQSIEKAHNTTRDDGNMRCIIEPKHVQWAKLRVTAHRTMMTALLNQPEACTSDLGGDKSRYLYSLCCLYM